MSRNLKRVPLNFDWPAGVVWKGYISPYRPVDCHECSGRGYSKEALELEDRWFSWGENLQYSLTQEDIQALVDANRLWDFTRVPINDEQREIVKKKVASGENSWLPFNNGRIPSAQEVNEWAKNGFGHDAVNRMVVIEARLRKKDIPYLCNVCSGDGVLWQTDKLKKASEAWEPIDPPAGKGFQLWEDTSEGSPDSPVFKSLEELCEWCEENATTFGRHKASKEEWMKMLSDGIVCHKEGGMVFL